jgi:aspartyl-tRNA synthetase
MEMAFAAEDEVMAMIEKLLKTLWLGSLNMEIPTPFQRMTYQQAMASYGSDKPDLRLGMEVSSIVFANHHVLSIYLDS